MAESSNGKEKTGRGKDADGRSPKGKGKGGETGMKKTPQSRQRNPKVEMELTKKNKDEKVALKESKGRKKKEEVKKRTNTKGGTAEKEEGKTKGRAVEKEQVKKRTNGWTAAPEDKKKRSRNKMENGSSAAAGDDEEGGTASCSFPMSRVRRLMRLEGGNLNVVSGISSDAVFLVNKASEMFLEKFVEDSYGKGIKRQKKSLNYKDLSSTVHSRKKYEFLSDFVPEKLSAEDALKARTLMET